VAIVTKSRDFDGKHISIETGRVAEQANGAVIIRQGDSIVLTEAMELSHLDYEEFLAAYESMTLALVSHLRELAPYREAR